MAMRQTIQTWQATWRARADARDAADAAFRAQQLRQPVYYDAGGGDALAGFGVLLLTLLGLGLVGLVGYAVVLWSWRTVVG